MNGKNKRTTTGDGSNAAEETDVEGGKANSSDISDAALNMFEGMDAEEEAADQWVEEQEDSMSDDGSEAFDEEDEEDENNKDSSASRDAATTEGDEKAQALRRRMLRAALGFETVLPR